MEVEEKVAKACAELAEGHRLDLELLKAEFEGRTSVLKTERQAMEQRESIARGPWLLPNPPWIPPAPRYPLSEASRRHRLPLGEVFE